MMIIRVTDVETCGLESGDGVVEIGWCDVKPVLHDGVVVPHRWAVGVPRAVLVNPGRRIPPDMSAIHHITDEMVADAPTLGDALSDLPGAVDAYAAHHAIFEQSFLCGDEPPLLPRAGWICTWKGAIHLAPRAPTHSNQGLRYFLKLAVDPELASPPHRAGPDAYVTACLLIRMLAKATVDELVAITARPAILPYLSFGEHAMKPIEQVPESYLTWILKKGAKKPGEEKHAGGFDEDVRATAFHHLNLRRQA